MKTIKKNNATDWYEQIFDFLGCAKTINVNGEKVKAVYDMLNFNRSNREYVSEFDLCIGGKEIGHVTVVFSNLYRLNGMEFETEKAMIEHAFKNR